MNTFEERIFRLMYSFQDENRPPVIIVKKKKSIKKEKVFSIDDDKLHILKSMR